MDPFPHKPPRPSNPAIGRRAALLAPVLLAVSARRAAAHAVLVASYPAPNTIIPMGQTTFTLRFNTRVDQARSRVILFATDGLQTVLSIFPAGDPEVITAVGIVNDGGQSLRWQVLAADGHITRGEIPFKAVRT
jgi:copper resistance protein C